MAEVKENKGRGPIVPVILVGNEVGQPLGEVVLGTEAGHTQENEMVGLVTINKIGVVEGQGIIQKAQGNLDTIEVLVEMYQGVIEAVPDRIPEEEVVIQDLRENKKKQLQANFI